MRIGIDARLWGAQHAGIGRYVAELIRNLQLIDKTNQYVIFCRKNNLSDIPVKKNWQKVMADVPHYTLREQLLLLQIFNRENLDMLHVPHFNVPFGYRRPFVVTIHDLLWHRIRGFGVTTQGALIYLAKYLGYRATVATAVRQAKKILVPSETVKTDLVRRFRVPADKVVVTYEGVPPHFNISIYTSKKIMATYGIKKPYLLYVGSLYPHKNMETLVRALKILPAPPTLVIVSSRSVFWERFRKFIEKENATNFVQLVGYVPDKDLGAIYKNAEAFVFPTLSEGFGLPGLEAMGAGCPVVSSDIPVLREIYGEAALYFNPKNTNELARAIRRIYADKKLRAQLVKKGKERVKKYSWRQMARQTLAVYKEVLGKQQ